MFRVRAVLSVTFVLVCPLLTPRITFASQTCLTGTDPAAAGDAAQLEAVRGAVDAACVCSAYDGTAGKTNKDYLTCAKDVLKAAASAGNLRNQCKGVAKAFFANASCGMDPALHAQPCIETSLKSGKLKCKVRPQTKKDGTTPTNACVSTAKTSKESCADDTRCLTAADVNDDLRIAAPGDDGRCRPMDCESQLTRDLARCDAPTAACEQSCAQQTNYPSCNDGCQYGVIHCKKLANQAHDACVADPHGGCAAARDGAATRCVATVTLPADATHPEPRTMSAFRQYCEYSRYFDVFCYNAIQAFWENPCVSKADEAFAECRAD